MPIFNQDSITCIQWIPSIAIHVPTLRDQCVRRVLNFGELKNPKQVEHEQTWEGGPEQTLFENSNDDCTAQPREIVQCLNRPHSIVQI